MMIGVRKHSNINEKKIVFTFLPEDMVHRVHLRGAFIITRAAWPYFRKQNYGRFVIVLSLLFIQKFNLKILI